MRTAITLGVAAALSMVVLVADAQAQGYFGSASWFTRSNEYARNLSLQRSAYNRRNGGYLGGSTGGGLQQVEREDRQLGTFRIPTQRRSTWGGTVRYVAPRSGGSWSSYAAPYQAPRSDRAYRSPVSDGGYRSPVSDGGWVSPRSGR